MAKVYEIDGIVPAIDPTSFVHPDAVLIGDADQTATSGLAPCCAATSAG